MSWLAFGLLLVLLTGGAVIIFLEISVGIVIRIIYALLWIPGVLSSVYLFKNSSGSILKITSEDSATPEQKKTRPSATGQPVEMLDIQGIAKKVVRRTSLDVPMEKWSEALLTILAKELEIMSGLVYAKNKKGVFESVAMYAFPHAEAPYTFKEGEGLTGQAVKNRQLAVYRQIPDDYAQIFSGLGSGKPAYLAIIPVETGGEVRTAIELAGFRYAEENLEQLFSLLTRELIGKMEQQKNQGTQETPKTKKG